jgi:hypothetical protein
MDEKLKLAVVSFCFVLLLLWCDVNRCIGLVRVESEMFIKRTSTLVVTGFMTPLTMVGTPMMRRLQALLWQGTPPRVLVQSIAAMEKEEGGMNAKDSFLSEDGNAALAQMLFADPRLDSWPLPPSVVFDMGKKLLHYIDSNGGIPSESLYLALSKELSSSASADAGYFHYFLEDSIATAINRESIIVPVRLHDNGLAFRVWPAAIVLMQLIWSLPDFQNPKSSIHGLLELGGGTGLSSLFAAFSRKFTHVCCTDYEAQAMQALMACWDRQSRTAADENPSESEVTSFSGVTMDWKDLAAVERVAQQMNVHCGGRGQWDVMAGDCLYDPTDIPVIEECIRTLYSCGARKIWWVNAVRRPETLEEFQTLLIRRQWRITTRQPPMDPVLREVEVGGRHDSMTTACDICVWEIDKVGSEEW